MFKEIMKVTIIANGFQEDYIHNLIRALAFHVEKIDFIGSDIYCFDNFPKNVNVLNLRGSHDSKSGPISKALRVLMYFLKLTIYLVRSPNKVVHVQWLRFDAFEGICFSLLIRLLGKKVIYTAHNILPHNTDGWNQKLKFKVIYSVQSQIIVHTEFVKSQINRKFGISLKKIDTIPHGVYEPLKNSNVDSAFARKRLHLPAEKKVALFFGRFSAYKGFDLIVDAVKEMKNKGDIVILVAGRVIETYQKEFDNLRERANSLNFNYILKHVTDEEMEYCFKAADFCIIPYREASQSGVLFMSYAYGTPVIVSNIGGFPEDIIEGKTGYLFESGSPGNLAKILDQAVLMTESSELFSRNELIEFATTHYSWHLAAKKLSSIYKKNSN